MLEQVAPASRSGRGGASAIPVEGSPPWHLAPPPIELGVFGQTFRPVDLRARRSGRLEGHLENDRAEGEFDWRRAGKGTLSRFHYLRLVRDASAAPPLRGQSLVIDEAVEDPPAACPPSARRSSPSATDQRARPPVASRGSRATAQPLAARDRFASENADGRLAGRGSGAQASASARSSISASRPQRWGADPSPQLPDVVRGAASLASQLAWRGAPTRIDYPSLSGGLRLETGASQFSKRRARCRPPARHPQPAVAAAPDHARLPRRVLQGFAFDRISGSIGLARGVLRSEDLEIRGPAAHRHERECGRGLETQDLCAGAADAVRVGRDRRRGDLLNPWLGGDLSPQKMLSDPIEALRLRYAVTGAWSDPQVAKRSSLRQIPADLGADVAATFPPSFNLCRGAAASGGVPPDAAYMTDASSSTPVRIAAIQTVSGPDVAANLDRRPPDRRGCGGQHPPGRCQNTFP